MGGVLPYKWEAYCSTNGRCTVGFPYLQGLEARKVQQCKWGAYCRTNWRCTAVLSSRPVGVGFSETLLNNFGADNWENPKGGSQTGLKPQIFRENRGGILPGKSGLFGANWRHFRAGRDLFGADRDQFLCTPQPRGRAEIAPKGPFLARLAPFGLSPPLLSPRLDFPETINNFIW